jgi:hypothetical protein
MSAKLKFVSRGSILALLVFVLLISASVTFAETSVFTGFIASGSQYDLYSLTFTVPTQVTATLVCDFDGVSRPLDPVLSVFDEFGNPADIITAILYNDDGFGLDDFPNGVDCDAFDSSYLNFNVEPGTYTFRVDGFGSSTGPYTLTINHTVITGHQFTDGRINPHNHAPAVVYCNGTTADIYSPAGVLLMSITADEAAAAAAGAVVESAGGAAVSKTADGRLSLLATLPDGKGYLFIWNGCPAVTSETYTIEGGVGILFETRRY